MLAYAGELHAAMANDDAPEELLRRFDLLADYTRRHFAFEERLMAEHQYPGLAAHRHEHAHLLQRLALSREVLCEGRMPRIVPPAAIDDDWILLHVGRADRRLGEFLNRQGVF